MKILHAITGLRKAAGTTTFCKQIVELQKTFGQEVNDLFAVIFLRMLLIVGLNYDIILRVVSYGSDKEILCSLSLQ